MFAELRRGGILWLLSAAVSGACSHQSRATRTSVSPEPGQGAAGAPALPARPRLIKVRLTLSSPDDLLVKAGDRVAAGASLCDRAAERRRLRQQHGQLTLAARQVDAQVTAANETARLLASIGPRLPPSSFAAEQASVRRAAAVADSEARKVEEQRRRLISLPASLPAGFDREAIVEHETARLQSAEDVTRQAQAEVDFARARLQAAREAREVEEARHTIEMARQALAVRSQLEQVVAARAQLASQLAALDEQLARLASVRAPFAGRVERVNWEEQHDQAISVVLYLAVADQ